MTRLFPSLNTVGLRIIAFLLFFSPILNAQVFINEVCSSNSSLIVDPDFGKYGDWIELYNAGDASINIGEWYLSDDSSNLFKWQIPSGTFLEPAGYKLIFADGKGTKLHTNYNLSKDGELLVLSDSSGVFIDSLSVPFLLNDLSYGNLPADPELHSVFAKPTPGIANIGTASVRIASLVEFSISGGFYTGAQTLALSYPYPDQVIYYSTDGSFPNKSSKIYSEPLLIEKTSVIRAICFEEGAITGVPLTQSYFIDEPQNLPVFSLATDSVNLFSDETGIMVQGTAGVAGYCTSVPYNLNRDWERPVNLEFYEDDGSQAMNQMCGAKIFGGCSRIRYPQKSLAFYARSAYESSSFSHQLFLDKNAKEYESFVLRASGDDQPKTIFRDALTQTLVKDVIDVDVQGYRPVVLYINGAYWGIINMREKLNEHYAENNYGVNADSVDVLRRNPENSWNVLSGSADHYNAMMDYIKTHDLTAKSNYDYVAEQMDMDEYINYQIIQIFFGGRDWPGNNIKFWRSHEAPYTKWRWILYDLDAHSIDAVGNIMEEATELDCECGWPNPPWSTYLFRTLLENEEFAAKFIERFNTYTNTIFARDRYISTINEMQNRLAPEIPRHIERWGGQKVIDPDNTWMWPIFNSVEEWNNQVQEMRNFAELRHEIAVEQVNDYFGIEGTKRLNIFNTDSVAGTIMLGNTPLYDSTFSGNYSTGTDIEIGVLLSPGFILSKWEKVIYTSIDNILISKGDEWKYNDRGEWLDYSWRSLDYDDASWSTGNAEFGYGDGDETTVVGYGPDAANKYITTNFRKVFQLEDPKATDIYELQIKRDDAAVVYLNNREVVKENMPQWGHNNTTTAVTTIQGDEEDRYLIFNLNPDFFVKGDNIIAVEIHQVGASSSDISFDLQLKSTSMVAGEVSEINASSVQLDMVENIGLTAYVIPDSNVMNKVFINEVMSSNIDKYPDEAGDYEDWIEIYNAGDEAVNLAGFFLSDSLPATKAWRFPVNNISATTIQADSFIVVFADKEEDEGPLHANFKLNKDGEEVALLRILAEDTAIVDHVVFEAQYNNVSWGRFPDGAADFKFMPVTTAMNSNFWEEMDTTSVEDMQEMGMLLYPNPTTSLFYIELTGAEHVDNIHLSVYSFTGSEIMQLEHQGTGRIEVSLSGKPAGLYFIEIMIEDRRIVRKLILE